MTSTCKRYMYIQVQNSIHVHKYIRICVLYVIHSASASTHHSCVGNDERGMVSPVTRHPQATEVCKHAHHAYTLPVTDKKGDTEQLLLLIGNINIIS